MIFKEKNNQNNQKKKHWFLYLITGVLFYKFFNFLRKESDIKDKISDIEHNFLDFLHKEKKEVIELENHKENLAKFYSDSYHIFLDYFIPFEGNNHKPKILHTRSLLIIAGSIIILKIALLGYLFLAHPNDGRMSEDIVAQVIAKVNQDRALNNLPELKINNVLSASAMLKAQDMIDKDYFAHYNPDGKKPWDFINRSQYEYLYVGENLAINFTNAEAVHSALMNSPSHKKNILSDRYVDIGIAMLSGELQGKQTNVLVELFATKKEPLPPNQLPVNKDVEVVKSENVVDEKIVVLSESDNPASVEEKENSKIEPVVELIASIDKSEIKEDKQVKEIEIEKNTVEQVSIPSPKIVKKISTNQAVLSQAEDKALNSPNPELEDKSTSNIVGFENKIDKEAIVATGVSKSINIVTMAVSLLMSALLIINIIIRFEVQHKPVILQTLLLIVFISSLVFLKLHNLENGLYDILIL